MAFPDDRPALSPERLRSALEPPAGPLARVVVVERTGSTNADLMRDLTADVDSWPDLSVLVADHQDAGRGRADRAWQTPPGTSATCSFVIKPAVSGELLGWLPLLAGLATATAVRRVAGVDAVLKWPNDVLVPAPTPVEGWGPWRKVAGILAEVVPVRRPAPSGRPAAVVVGIGVNVAQDAGELAVPHATSLALAAGRAISRETVLVALAAAAAEVTGRWRAAQGDARASGLADQIEGLLASRGSAVSVSLPGGEVVEGVVVGLDDDAALLLRGDDGRARRILAGDVRHLRAAG